MSQALEHNSCSNAGDTKQGRIQDFKLGRGAHLKKLRRAEGGAKMFRVFRVKNHDFTPKNNFCFSILGGRAPGTRPPHPESAPAKGRC